MLSRLSCRSPVLRPLAAAGRSSLSKRKTEMTHTRQEVEAIRAEYDRHFPRQVWNASKILPTGGYWLPRESVDFNEQKRFVSQLRQREKIRARAQGILRVIDATKPATIGTIGGIAIPTEVWGKPDLVSREIVGPNAFDALLAGERRR